VREHYTISACHAWGITELTTNYRGINAGSKQDMDDLCAAIIATQATFEDIIDKVWPFDEAEKAIQYIWEGRQVGKVVLTL
jgi:NADPH:quinone reductase-like Zn-dependent oxidoreductase